LNIVNSEIANSSALKSGETQRMAQVAAVMLDMKINFAKDKLEGGSYIYRLDPPLETIAILDETARQKHTVGKYTMRQLLVQAMQKERGARAKRTLEQDATELTSTSRPNASPKTGEPEAKKLKVEPKKKRVSFFVAGASSSESTTQDARENSPVNVEPSEDRVWVQYIEGFSNAVRKDLTWVEFINS
jgi:chromosome transmission fidelity protein 18